MIPGGNPKVERRQAGAPDSETSSMSVRSRSRLKVHQICFSHDKKMKVVSEMKIDPGMTFIDHMCEVMIYSSSGLGKERSFNLNHEFCRRWNFSMYCALHDEASQRMNMMFETCVGWKVEEILSSTPHKKNRKEYFNITHQGRLRLVMNI